jgi:hypothetical protein
VKIQETKEFTIPIPINLEQILDDMDKYIANLRERRRENIELAKELSKFRDALNKAEMYQKFLDATTQDLTKAGARDQDVQAVLTPCRQITTDV